MLGPGSKYSLWRGISRAGASIDLEWGREAGEVKGIVKVGWVGIKAKGKPLDVQLRVPEYGRVGQPLTLTLDIQNRVLMLDHHNCCGAFRTPFDSFRLILATDPQAP